VAAGILGTVTVVMATTTVPGAALLRLSVAENLEYFAGLYGLNQAGGRINDALEAVNLGDRAGDLCGGLSKGLRQRVGLARTLLSDPEIMFPYAVAGEREQGTLEPLLTTPLRSQELIVGKGVAVMLPTVVQRRSSYHADGEG
jgi:ABC-type ATPase involved in cell division